MQLSVQDIARMMDLSVVRTDVDLAEVRELAEQARKWNCMCTFAMPCYTSELVRLLADAPEVGVGGVVGFVVMYLLFKLGEVFMRIVNRKRNEGEEVEEVALGFGDVNLAGVVGLFLGWPPVILGLLFAVFIGGLISIFLIFFSLFRKEFRAFMAMPYAPFLAVAALAMLLLPDQIAALLGVGV